LAAAIVLTEPDSETRVRKERLVSETTAERTDPFLVTAEGYAQLRAELEELLTEARGDMSARVERARTDGDLADNSALYDALEEQTQLERRIAALEEQLAGARIAEPPVDGTAGVGSWIRVRDEATGEIAQYELVGAIETDVGNGRVSVDAPVGRALAGRRRGDVVEVGTPRGLVRLELLDVGLPGRSQQRAA
jgi:transcription elongation GreA/GreB family factor